MLQTRHSMKRKGSIIMKIHWQKMGKSLERFAINKRLLKKIIMLVLNLHWEEGYVSRYPLVNNCNDFAVCMWENKNLKVKKDELRSMSETENMLSKSQLVNQKNDKIIKENEKSWNMSFFICHTSGWRFF